MKPNLNLTLNDPLAEHAITIVLHLSPGENQAERPLLLSLGVPDQLPVQTQGTFTDLERLIRTTWTSFGMQMKANAAATATPTSHPETDDALEDEEGDEAFVAAAETDDITVATAPLTPPTSTPPASAKPTKRPVLEQPTLSLF
ncbi:MAG: hypothetical protein IPL78_19300 [Chloroflexi bacterium]|nr:hypothetical protein [Chloroflexota bacterium]